MELPQYIKDKLNEYGLVDNHGDTVWYNAQVAIAYKNTEILENIKKHCITKKANGKYRFWRRPETVGNPDDDMSRDQLTMFYTAMKLLGVMDKKYLNIGWRISAKFRCTPDFWLWKESLRGGIYGWIMALLFHSISGIWNVVVMENQLKMDSAFNLVPWKDWKRTPDEDLTEQQKTFMKGRMPDYAIHLYSWQVYCSSWTPLKSLPQYIVEKMSYPDNLLLMSHLGKNITRQDVMDFPKWSVWVWQRRPNETCRMYAKIHKTEEEYLKDCGIIRDIALAVVDRETKPTE